MAGGPADACLFALLSWVRAHGQTDALSQTALAASFPHRSAEERDDISRCFLGAATWNAVCAAFGIDFQRLPDKTSDLLSDA
jgi:hypothetical protein